MMIKDVKEKWGAFKNSNGCMQRLDPKHPLNFFIGVSNDGFEELALITVIEPANLISSKFITVEKNVRNDGRWATQIYSVSKENEDIFARFCVDLVECSQNCLSEAEGISLVTQRYLAWQKLFSKLREGLPINALKGLIGEIQFAKTLIDKGINIDKVIDGWQGPNGADRDFVLEETWYEIKSVSTGKEKVTISSLNQLESDIQGTLVLNYIDESSKTDMEAKSVKQYIEDFRKTIQDYPLANNKFEDKLTELGYADLKKYEDIYFRVGKKKYFRVDDEFPKIVTENVPKEVVSIRYDLSVAAIQKWEIKEEEIWSL